MKVVVAMSGGVDSSVAAALLRRAGHDVVGMMLRLWSEPGTADSNRCCTPQSMALARQVARQLDIPFYVIDAKETFRSTVVGAFLDGYERGETPNPCLECNRAIRWTLLIEHALAMGADFMATGHYARLEHDPSGRVKLMRAHDPSKDQSYVLHVLNQVQLRHALFPLGSYLKSEVRKMAEEFSLPTASRSDSQDLCFLAGDDYRNFLQRQRPQMLLPGEIVDAQGRSLGGHNGLANYTIGQRRALQLHSPVPMYVLRKETATNRLVVGPESELGSDCLSTRDVNWVGGEPFENPFRAAIKTRYTAAEQPGEVFPVDHGSRVKVHFEAKQRDITSGQAAVFYVGDEVIGGGLIQ
jgi:tRNA-specific 2-thiouridylase